MFFPPLLRCVAAALGLAAVAASAQPIQRCEGPDGKVTYSNSACPGGSRTVREVDTSPAVTAGEQRAARDRAQRDAKALNEIERSRTEEQKAQQRLLDKAHARDERCTKLRLRAELARDQLQGEAMSNKRPPLQKKYALAQREYETTCPKR
jgi:hypothetical protein